MTTAVGNVNENPGNQLKDTKKPPELREQQSWVIIICGLKDAFHEYLYISSLID